MRTCLPGVTARLGLCAALSLAACQTPAPREDWEPVRDRPAAAGGTVAPSAAGSLPPQLDPLRPPGALDYPPPPAARLVATFNGPEAVAPRGELELPVELWGPAAPPEIAAAIEEERLAAEIIVDGSEELDLDGDGVKELVVLFRPVALFETEDAPDRFALLLSLAKDGGKYRLAAAQRFTPRRHAAPGGPTRWCHAEYRLAGSLRRNGGAVPLVFEERGVDCAVMQGGGFDRVIHVVDLARPGGTVPEGLVGRGRLGPGGSMELYDGVAWAADVDGDKAEELLVRGITIGARPCGAGLDPPYWIEELGPRALSPGGAVRFLGPGGATPLPGGSLAPEQLRSHPASCGPPPRPGAPR